MNKAKYGEFFWHFFVSPEFCVLLFVVLSKLLFSSIFVNVGGWIGGAEFVSFIGVAVVGLLGFAINRYNKILNPQENNKILYKWPDYWKLKLRVGISIFYSCLSVLYYSIYLYSLKKLDSGNMAVFAILSLLNSSVVSLIALVYSQKIQEIVTVYTEKGHNDS